MARKYKWEIYVDKVLSGMKQVEAYKSTFNCSKMKESTIYETASAMLHDKNKYPKSSARYFELSQKAKEQDDEKAIADSREMQEKLTAIIRQAIEEEIVLVDPAQGVVKVKKTAAIKEIISAINMLAKMQGLFRDNVSIDGNVGVVIVDDIENS